LLPPHDYISLVNQSVGVIGLGYVGLPLAVSAGKMGAQVVGFDTNSETVDLLSKGFSHVQDVDSAELKIALRNGLSVSSDPAALLSLDTYVICVPTPLGSSGHPDLSHVEAAAATVAQQLRKDSLVILESTTYPGTTDEVVRPILERGSGLTCGVDFTLAYSPERIDPGNSEFGLENTPKVVGGFNLISLERAATFYSGLGIPVVPAKGTREAELAKLLENTYRHVNIALVNEMAKFSRALGIDLRDAIDCAATKPFGFEAFYPGPGVGGHCIPIDPNYLSFRVRAQLGYPFRFVELAQEINASMPTYVVNRIQELLNEHSKSLKGARILICGVTYKKDVADQRESPADPVARGLLQLGANLSYLDPHVAEWQVNGRTIEGKLGDEIDPTAFDCAVVLQMHSAFQDIRWGSFPLILDTRNGIKGENVAFL